MKILLAVDGSKIALEAARQLIAHVGWFKEPPQVRVVTVHRPVPHVGGMSAMVRRRKAESTRAARSRPLARIAGLSLSRGCCFTLPTPA